MPLTHVSIVFCCFPEIMVLGTHEAAPVLVAQHTIKFCAAVLSQRTSAFNLQTLVALEAWRTGLTCVGWREVVDLKFLHCETARCAAERDSTCRRGANIMISACLSKDDTDAIYFIMSSCRGSSTCLSCRRSRWDSGSGLQDSGNYHSCPGSGTNPSCPTANVRQINGQNF